MYTTFSPYNGYLWTDFLNISFAHIDLNFVAVQAQGTRA